MWIIGKSSCLPIYGPSKFHCLIHHKHRFIILYTYQAPYVAGQLDYCIQHIDRCIPVLLGFNPVKLARSV